MLPNCRFRIARKRKKIHPRCGQGACLGADEHLRTQRRQASGMYSFSFSSTTNLQIKNSRFHPFFSFFVHRYKLFIINRWFFYKNHLCSSFGFLNISCSWKGRKRNRPHDIHILLLYQDPYTVFYRK